MRSRSASCRRRPRPTRRRRAVGVFALPPGVVSSRHGAGPDWLPGPAVGAVSLGSGVWLMPGTLALSRVFWTSVDDDPGWGELVRWERRGRAGVLRQRSAVDGEAADHV